jgi:hypothetical protein
VTEMQGFGVVGTQCLNIQASLTEIMPMLNSFPESTQITNPPVDILLPLTYVWWWINTGF